MRTLQRMRALCAAAMLCAAETGWGIDLRLDVTRADEELARSGARVYVNYGEKAATVDGVTIPTQDWTLKEKEER